MALNHNVSEFLEINLDFLKGVFYEMVYEFEHVK